MQPLRVYFVGVLRLSPFRQTSFPHRARLGLNDGLDWEMGEPLRFGRESDGRFLFLLANASLYGNTSYRSGSAYKTGCHCEFTAPEGAYVRKEQKAHFSPKNGVFLRSAARQSSVVFKFQAFNLNLAAGGQISWARIAGIESMAIRMYSPCQRQLRTLLLLRTILIDCY